MGLPTREDFYLKYMEINNSYRLRLAEDRYSDQKHYTTLMIALIGGVLFYGRNNWNDPGTPFLFLISGVIIILYAFFSYGRFKHLYEEWLKRTATIMRIEDYLGFEETEDISEGKIFPNTPLVYHFDTIQEGETPNQWMERRKKESTTLKMLMLSTVLSILAGILLILFGAVLVILIVRTPGTLV